MAERINKDEFVRQVAKRMKVNETTAQTWIDTMLDTMYDTFRRNKGITLPGFGGFYLDKRRDGCAFKFNPARNYALCSAGPPPTKDLDEAQSFLTYPGRHVMIFIIVQEN